MVAIAAVELMVGDAKAMFVVVDVHHISMFMDYEKLLQLLPLLKSWTFVLVGVHHFCISFDF